MGITHRVALKQGDPIRIIAPTPQAIFLGRWGISESVKKGKRIEIKESNKKSKSKHPGRGRWQNLGPYIDIILRKT
jgi:hypothetical protein